MKNCGMYTEKVYLEFNKNVSTILALEVRFHIISVFNVEDIINGSIS